VKTLAIVLATALLAAGCGSGGKSNTPPGNPSNNTSVCAYVKPVGSRDRVYVELAVTPVSLEPATCSVFNSRFGGRKMPPDLPRGTGRPHCGYTKSNSSSTIRLGVFASSRSTGLAYCRSFRPGPGFKRDYGPR